MTQLFGSCRIQVGMNQLHPGVVDLLLSTFAYLPATNRNGLQFPVYAQSRFSGKIRFKNNDK